MPMITQQFGFDARGANRSLTNLAGNLDKATDALNRLKTAGGGTGLVNLGGQIDNAKKKSEGLTVSWQTMVRVITTQILVRSLNGLIDGLSNAIEKARELGLAIAEIKTISGGLTGLPVQNLTQEVLDLSSALGQDAAQVAEGVYQTLSNQVVKAADAMEFYSAAARLANATNSTSAASVDALSSVMNSYQLSMADLTEVQDTLFKSIELGRFRMEDLGSSLGKILPLASEMGIDYREVAAALAVTTQQGMNLSTATTEMSAVLQKLLRPSEEMERIFHSWGVESGPEAIRAFGGMGGVLQKLQEETNGNVAEMGDLFQRVRSIAGAMALGVNNGQKFAQTYDDIKNAVGSAKSAIDEFESSEAFKLTQQQQALNNEWTELGTNLIPVATSATNVLNNNVKAFGLLIDAASGKFTATWGAQQRVLEQQRNLNQAVKEYNESFEVPEAGQLDQLSKDTAQYYAEVNKYEMRLRQVRDESVKAASKALADAGDNIVKAYQDGIKEIEKFIDNARELWRKAANEIADIRREADDAELEHRLDNAQTAAEKMRILDQEIAQQRRKADEASRKVGADPASKEAALAEKERLQSLLDSAEAIAKEAGQRQKVLQYQNDEVKVIKSKEELIKKNYDATLRVVDAVKQVQGSWEEAAQKLDELFTRREGLLDKLAGLDLTKNTDKAAADRVGAELNELDKKIEGIFAQGRYSAKFLQSLGVDTTFAKVSDGLQGAFDKATFNWAREVDRARAAFEAQTFNIKVALDPVGRGAAAGEALGMQQGIDEGSAAFLQRVQQAGVEQFEAQGKAVQNIQSEMMRVAGIETQINTIGQGILTGLQQRQEFARTIAESSKMSWNYQAPTAEAQARVDASMKSQTQSAQELVQLLQQTHSTIQNGKILTDEQLTSLREQVLEKGKSLGLDNEQNAALQQALQLLQEANQRQQIVNQEAAKIPEKGKLDAIRAYIQQLNVQVQQQRVGEEAAQKAKQAVEGEARAANNAASAAGTLSTNMQGAATGANNTAAGTQNTTAALPSTIGLANSLAQAFAKAAEQAERMARAAAAGGAAANYHGGPMNKWFAAGGSVTRGQDKILTALSAGETVVNSKNSRKFFSELNAMNQGSQPVYREQGGPVTNVGDINVTVNGGDSSQQTVREIAHALRREAKRGNIKLR